MAKNYQEMKKTMSQIKEGDLFLVTITRFDKKNNNLKTSLFMENFFLGDLDGTKEIINDLIDGVKKN